MQVVLLTAEHDAPAALLEVLRAAGMCAAVAAGRPEGRAPDDEWASPRFVLIEVADGADAGELRAALGRAAAAWTGALFVACRRPHTTADAHAHRHDALTLQRLGFHAVADDPEQLPALLRELADSGAQADAPQVAARATDERAHTPASLLLPEHVGVAELRAAFEAVASLHFVTDQRSAAQALLAGLAPLVSAERWVLYLTEEARGPAPAGFEPLAVRGQTRSERSLSTDDWRRALAEGDPLLALTGRESRAARTAVARNETVRQTEGARHALAVPLASAGRVLGVVEALREDAAEFTAREAALITALAAPAAAALANSVRIAEAERLSLTDDLTKLHNARFLRQYLTGEIKRARRYGSSVTCLFLDLDDFKEVNDRHGHLVGSHVLMEMATVILTGVRDTDVVARYGGDEFVVVLPETNAEQATYVAERIREKIAQHAFTGGRALGLRLTASFGVASFPQHAQSPQQLLAGADAAMYEAKAVNKNCVRLAARTEQGRG